MYPGDTVGLVGYAPSIRTKWSRDGINDWEYVNILRGFGLSSWVTSQIDPIAHDFANWTRDYTQVEAVRILLGNKIEQLSGGPPVPVITSPTVAQGNVGTTFSYQITATNSATAYGAVGLPLGLSLNAITGVISGTPTASGQTQVTISASNAGGTGNAILTITISDFTLSAAPAQKAVAQGGSTTYTVTVGSLAGFTGTVNLGASGLPQGATASFSPASITGSGTSTMTVTAAPSSPGGTYTVTMTGTSGGTLSHSTAATLVVTIAAPAAAVFARLDTTTQGTWKGVYGADGETIANDSAVYPSYARVNFSVASLYTWAASTADPRALQKAAASDRIASAWYGTSNFSIDVNLTDGNAHEVALYCLDWEPKGRAERIDILDAVSGNVLDSRSLSVFSNGVWLVWNLIGHVTIRVTLTGGTGGSVVSGVFFAPPAAPDFALSASPSTRTAIEGSGAAYTVTLASLAGFTGRVNLSASGLPSGATAGFSPTSVSGSGSSTLTVTPSASTPVGSYAFTITGGSGALSHSISATLVVKRHASHP
jgi:hypothetical protein